MNVIKDSPGRRRDENGGDEGADGDSKDDIDSKRPAGPPGSKSPQRMPRKFAFYTSGGVLFWDMFNAQRGKGDGRNVLQYVTHTQVRTVMGILVKFKLGPSQGPINGMRQEPQQAMIRGIRGGTCNYLQGYQQAMDERGSSRKQYESQPKTMNLDRRPSITTEIA